MRVMTDKIKRFLVSEDGPTAVEYAVMLALIFIVCLVAITSISFRRFAVAEFVRILMKRSPALNSHEFRYAGATSREFATSGRRSSLCPPTGEAARAQESSR